MTDTQFKELDLDGEVSDMSEDEVRETLVDFVQAHKENRAAYDATVSEFEDKLDEIRTEKEAAEDELGEIHSQYAERAAEVTNMPASLIEERFDFSEVKQILEEAEEAGEFSEESEESEESDESRLTNFTERPDKGKQEKESTGTSQFRDDAEQLMKRKLNIDN